ncbi:hypothetical protein GY45DRAFT_207836 [Cubamyces sp. BRFM 1775]|nr:hypothetical protein GY45DRAFT_207836 [Cubamyces sp. BRFM 1775]
MKGDRAGLVTALCASAPGCDELSDRPAPWVVGTRVCWRGWWIGCPLCFHFRFRCFGVSGRGLGVRPPAQQRWFFLPSRFAIRDNGRAECGMSVRSSSSRVCEFLCDVDCGLWTVNSELWMWTLHPVFCVLIDNSLAELAGPATSRFGASWWHVAAIDECLALPSHVSRTMNATRRLYHTHSLSCTRALVLAEKPTSSYAHSLSSPAAKRKKFTPALGRARLALLQYQYCPRHSSLLPVAR